MSINSKWLRTFATFALAAMVCVTMSCSDKKTKVKTIAPAITSTAPTTAVVGTLYSYSIIATGNPIPSLSVTGLPTWLSFDGTDTISGTPGTGDVGLSETITVTASNGIASNAVQAFAITVSPAPAAPAITSTATTSATVGTLYSYAITATGNPVPSLSVTGLPAWLSFDGVDLISGTPASDDVVPPETITVTASNGIEPNAVQTFAIEVEIWIDVSGSVIVSGELSSIEGAVLRLMDGMTVSASCVITSGMYALTVRPGNYAYNITYPNYFMNVTIPVGGNITVNMTDIVQDVHIDTTSIGYFKASNTGIYDYFGLSVAIDGDTMVVGAYMEDSNATGINGEQLNDNTGNTGAVYVFVRTAGVWSQEAYLKASNTGENDEFGWSVAISGDTIVVGARQEDSNATGIDGNQTDNSALDSGVAYVFVRNAGVWSQQAYLKASNTDASDWFGWSVAISGDTIVVGASYEDSNATGVNGSQSDNSVDNSGAAYVFVRNTGVWTQQAYLKASNTEADDYFGNSVAISGDTIVVGAYGEDSNATGINGIESDNSTLNSGAAYVFVRSAGIWSQQAYLKASNTGENDMFGISVAISGDTIVVGAHGEDSNATGINGNQSDNSTLNSGAAYVFVSSGGIWSQQTYLKASNTGAGDLFGTSVSLDGDKIVIGAGLEDSNASDINGDQLNNSASDSGAAYVFIRNAGIWSQEAYLKASNTETGDCFGRSVAISGDTIVVGAYKEDSNAIGINGNQLNNTGFCSGAAYLYSIH